MKQFTFGKRVAYFQRAVVVKAYNISRPCFINNAFFIGHKVRRA